MFLPVWLADRFPYTTERLTSLYIFIVSLICIHSLDKSSVYITGSILSVALSFNQTPQTWEFQLTFIEIQFSSVIQSCLTLCDAIDCSMPGFPLLHCLLELAQAHVHRVSDVDTTYSSSKPLVSSSSFSSLGFPDRSLKEGQVAPDCCPAPHPGSPFPNEPPNQGWWKE